MKKTLSGLLLVLFVLGGCALSQPDFAVKTAPTYKDGEATPFTISVEEDGEALAGMDIIAMLDMEKMDHGTMVVEFTDNKDGTYTAEVELPMGGEWIASIEGEVAGKTYEEVLSLKVREE